MSSTAAMTGGAVAGYATQQAINDASHRTAMLGLARCNLMETKQETIVCINKLEEKINSDSATACGVMLVVTLVFVGFVWWTTR